MKDTKNKTLEKFIEKYDDARDWILDHMKIVMPVFLIVCVLVTVLIAINANQKAALEKEAELAAATVESTEVQTIDASIVAPELALEENAYPEVNSLVKAYYDSLANGDIEAIAKVNTHLDEIAQIRIQELSAYIDAYPTIDVYTKIGPSAGTYVAYVYSEVKFTDMEQTVPGMQAYYIGVDADGNYFINDGAYDDTIYNYIKEISLQDDVVDLNNKVVVSYNEMLANDAELSEFVAYVAEKINEDVGVILAQNEQGTTTESVEETTEETTEEAVEETNANTTVTQLAKATEVVNIRSSDSETADKIDKAQAGQEFTLLEQKGNGWSKIEYNGKEAYIKSEYLEVEQAVEVAGSDSTNSSTATDSESNTDTQAASADTVSTDGTVTVIESVKVRSSASTSGDSLGTVYAGEKLDFVQKMSNGWTEVTYKGNVAYVKSEYVE